jgi:hypothetical protein
MGRARRRRPAGRGCGDGWAHHLWIVIEVRNPGVLAATIEIDLVRFHRAATMFRMPVALDEFARTLAKVAEMLREAEARGQAVDLGDEVVRVIQQFRGALSTVGGAPAQA